jgi:FkbM family methyltransferase
MIRPLLRQLKKNHYARKGRFPYFGETLHFPPDSYVFAKACEEGIYEREYVALLQFSIRPDTWYFDVGANIGLMSAPLLQTEPTLNVVSVEASPTTSACIARSAAESPNRARWHVVPKAMGDAPARLSFHANPAAGGAFDGLRDTGRVAGGVAVEVEVTTLDQVWADFGRPAVSVVKIDVEGAEPQVLKGARACLARSRPVVLLECNAINLAAYGQGFDDVLKLAGELNYDVVSIPGFCPVTNAVAFRYQSRVNENFLLMPRA